MLTSYSYSKAMTIEINFKRQYSGKIIMSWYENKDDKVPADLDELILIGVQTALDKYNIEQENKAMEEPEPYSDLVKFNNRI